MWLCYVNRVMCPQKDKVVNCLSLMFRSSKSSATESVRKGATWPPQTEPPPYQTAFYRKQNFQHHNQFCLIGPLNDLIAVCAHFLDGGGSIRSSSIPGFVGRLGLCGCEKCKAFSRKIYFPKQVLLTNVFRKLLTLSVSVALTDAVKATDTTWASIIAGLCLYL